MTDHTLHGNGEPCPACALRRDEWLAGCGAVDDFGGPTRDPRHVHFDCQLCDGSGIVPLADAEIIARAVAWAAVHYWPARIARWAKEEQR